MWLMPYSLVLVMVIKILGVSCCMESTSCETCIIRKGCTFIQEVNGKIHCIKNVDILAYPVKKTATTTDRCTKISGNSLSTSSSGVRKAAAIPEIVIETQIPRPMVPPSPMPQIPTRLPISEKTLSHPPVENAPPIYMTVDPTLPQTIAFSASTSSSVHFTHKAGTNSLPQFLTTKSIRTTEPAVVVTTAVRGITKIPNPPVSTTTRSIPVTNSVHRITTHATSATYRSTRMAKFERQIPTLITHDYFQTSVPTSATTGPVLISTHAEPTSSTPHTPIRAPIPFPTPIMEKNRPRVSTDDFVSPITVDFGYKCNYRNGKLVENENDKIERLLCRSYKHTHKFVLKYENIPLRDWNNYNPMAKRGLRCRTLQRHFRACKKRESHFVLKNIYD